MKYHVTYRNELNGERGSKWTPLPAVAFDKASEYLDRIGQGGMQFALNIFGDIFDPATKWVEFESHNRKILISIKKVAKA